MNKCPPHLLKFIREAFDKFDSKEIGIIATTLIGYTIASMDDDRMKIKLLHCHIEGLQNAFNLMDDSDGEMEFVSFTDKMH